MKCEYRRCGIRRFAVVAIAILLVAVAACARATPTPSPSSTPTPTPDARCCFVPEPSRYIREAVERTKALDLSAYRIREYQNTKSPGYKFTWWDTVHEVIPPDRLSSTMEAYELWLSPEEQSRYGSKAISRLCKPGDAPWENAGERIAIGKTRYSRACNGSWLVYESESLYDLTDIYHMEWNWTELESMKEVVQTGVETVYGATCDCFEGELTDTDGTPVHVAVCIGWDEGIVRRVDRAISRHDHRFDLYDINDPSISVEPPKCETVVELPSLWQMEEPRIPDEGCWTTPSIHPY